MYHSFQFTEVTILDDRLEPVARPSRGMKSYIQPQLDLMLSKPRLYAVTPLHYMIRNALRFHLKWHHRAVLTRTIAERKSLLHCSLLVLAVIVLRGTNAMT